MTRKDKQEIIKNIFKGFNYNQIGRLKEYINEVKFDEPLRMHRWSGNIHNDKIMLIGFYINKLFNLPILNDAPRGGMEGDYIIIKNTKDNREKLQFIKDFLEIY